MSFQQARTNPRIGHKPEIEPNPASDKLWTLAQFKKVWGKQAPGFEHWAHPLFMEFKQKEMNADPELTPAAFKLGIALLPYVNQQTGKDAFPGISWLAKLTTKSHRQVRRGIKQLETRRHMRVKRTWKAEKQREVNHYAPLLHEPNVALEAGLKRLATYKKGHDPKCQGGRVMGVP
jgi:hypothetical protein